MAIQHLLPQDISNYRFRLIGDMTIKQFASLGICIVLAIIAYSFPLPFFFKYPLVFAFILLGVGMAFVPVQGRSLDIWMIAFIKSIYSPTQYTWKSTPATPETAETAAPTPENNLAVARQVSNPSMEITQGSPLKQTPPEPPTTPIQSQEETSPEPTSTTHTVSPSTTPVVTSPLQSTSTPQPKTAPVESSAIQTPPPTINLPIPFTPTSPNTLVGLTLTPSGHILDGVMVEIKKNNLTLRATKSNKLGQFMFARPLDSGLYQILAEKEGNVFAPYSLELTGEIVKPLKIQAQ
ncbi:MAG TPA: PrgI family protein [Spirochaetia bacterium]|nr:PrgI family protein [Spirochaetia bacterium]